MRYYIKVELGINKVNEFLCYIEFDYMGGKRVF